LQIIVYCNSRLLNLKLNVKYTTHSLVKGKLLWEFRMLVPVLKPFLRCVQQSLNGNGATVSAFLTPILSSALCLFHSHFSSSERRQLPLGPASCQMSRALLSSGVQTLTDWECLGPASVSNCANYWMPHRGRHGFICPL